MLSSRAERERYSFCGTDGKSGSALFLSSAAERKSAPLCSAREKIAPPREKRKHSACKRIKLPSTNVSYTNYIIIRQKTQLIVKKFFSSLIFHISGHFQKKWKKFLKTCVHLSYLMCYNCLKYEQTFVFCKKVGTAGWTNAKNVG